MLFKNGHDDSSGPSDPSGLTLSREKARLLEPWMFGAGGVLRKAVGTLIIVDPYALIDAKLLEEHLAFGDSRAAVVVSTAPVLAAAYSDDLDCVAMLRFPRYFARRYQLSVGSKLLTVNTYYRQFTKHADLVFGPNHTGEWTGFFPLIAEFLSDDDRCIEDRKQEIDETEWQRCRELGDAYLFERPGVARNGRPRRCHEAAGAVKEAVIIFTVAVLVVIASIVVALKFL